MPVMQISSDMVQVVHPLEPVWDAHSRVLILGTMPSPASRAQGFYYGHPQNRFWQVLAAVLDQPVPAADPAARKVFALRHGIALYDVLQRCDIRGASDASIKNGIPNDLTPIFAGADIRAVFTTGAKAYALYQRLCSAAYGRDAIPLPSTSAANCRMSLAALTEAYLPVRQFLTEKREV